MVWTTMESKISHSLIDYMSLSNMKYSTRKLVLLLTLLFLSSQLLANTPVFVSESTLPVWTKKNIVSSHVNYAATKNISRTDIRPDLLNLTVLIESDGSHVTIVDSNKLHPVIRFPVRYPLQGKPIYDSTGQYVYLSSQEGWVSKFDLHQLKMVFEIRVGINANSIALSSDDRFIIVGNDLPNTMVVLDAKNLGLIKVIPTVDRKGKPSRVSAVHDAKPRRSFLASFKDSSELWEISYQIPPPAGFGEWVHDYRKDSGEADVRNFPVRRLFLNNPIDNFFLDQEYVHVIARSKNGKGQVVDLDLGRKVYNFNISENLNLFSGTTWRIGKKRVLAIPSPKEAFVNIIDMKNWEVIEKVPTLGVSSVISSFEDSPYAWLNISSEKESDVIQVIDKESLEMVKMLQPKPGQSIELLGFTRDGRHALVSQYKKNTSVIIYDVKTLGEVKRIPMKPVGNSEVYK